MYLEINILGNTVQTLFHPGQDSLVSRKICTEVPPRVEYSLTDIGTSLRPILDAMHKWGAKYMMQNGKKTEGEELVQATCRAKASVA